MNMFKKNGGFTLVELIVVIAILAILAGVAVPAYTGYINKAEQAKDMQSLAAINTAVQGVAAAEGVTVTKIEVSNEGAVTVTPTTITETMVEAFTGDIQTTYNWSNSFNGATWEDGEWTITSK